MNKKIDIGRPELNPIPVKSPWYHIGMDFIGPISPSSTTGNRYILTISDYFTKFSWAHALPTKEASGVVKALRQVSVLVTIFLWYYISCLQYSCSLLLDYLKL